MNLEAHRGADWDFPLDLIRVPTGQALQSLTFRLAADSINGTEVWDAKTITTSVTPGSGRVLTDGSDGRPASALFEAPPDQVDLLIPGKTYYWDVVGRSTAGKTYPVARGTLIAIEDVS